MGDTPMMDAVRDYTCPEIMYREGCRIERELAEARVVLAEIANQGYRGNRNPESQLAWQYINATLGRKEAGEVKGE